MAPPSKPAGTRQRRNKTSTNTVLTAPEPGAIDRPRLPNGIKWHSMTRAWWKEMWESPMAPEYDDSDIHGLYSLAILVNDFWIAPTANQRVKLSGEIRLQSQRYGLSPMDRRRLQWQIEKTKEEQDKGKRRNARTADRQQPQQPQHQQPGQPAPADPRGVLRLA